MRDVWAAVPELGGRAARCPLRPQQGVCRRRPSARGRRRAGTDTAGVRWRHPTDSRSDRPGRGHGRRCPRRGGCDRDLRRHDARSLPGPDGHAPRVRGIRGHGGAGDDTDRASTSRSGTSSARSRSPTASAGSRSGRRASRSPSPPRTEPTPSRPARTRSTRSRRRCRSGRKRSTRAARSGSARFLSLRLRNPRAAAEGRQAPKAHRRRQAAIPTRRFAGSAGVGNWPPALDFTAWRDVSRASPATSLRGRLRRPLRGADAPLPARRFAPCPRRLNGASRRLHFAAWRPPGASAARRFAPYDTPAPPAGLRGRRLRARPLRVASLLALQRALLDLEAEILEHAVVRLGVLP